MFRLYSPRKTEQIIMKLEPVIRRVSSDYQVPEAVIRAVLFREIKEIDLFDVIADRIVRSPVLSSWFHRTDSSTGYGQIFAWVAINALHFAETQGIENAENIGLSADHVYDKDSPGDRRLMWMKLNSDREFNLRMSVLNLLSCAFEMTGKTDFSAMNEEELKLTLSRYNANTKRITAYGEETYGYYLKYLQGEL